MVNGKTLKENVDYYIGSDGSAYFYNNVRTKAEAAGSFTMYFGGTSGGKSSLLVISKAGVPVEVLSEGSGYYIGADGKAHSYFGPPPPVPVVVEPKPPVPTKPANGSGTNNTSGSSSSTSVSNTFVEIAVREKGTQEDSYLNEDGDVVYNNNVKYNTWYYGEEVSGSDYAWCTTFVLWCANEAGLKIKTKSGNVWDYVGAYGNTTEPGREQYMTSTNDYHTRDSGYTPYAGDLIIFGKPGTGHIGIVVAYDSSSNTVYTVEGSSGNEVRIKQYSSDSSYITGYCSTGGTSNGDIPVGAQSGTGQTTG